MLRAEYIREIINNVKLHRNFGCKKIIHISGLFGTGKSWLLNRAEEEIARENYADAVFRLEKAEEMGYLPEFLNNAILTFKAVSEFDNNFLGEETAYNMNRYLRLLSYIKETDNLLFEEVLRNYVLKSDCDNLISESLNKQSPDYKRIIDTEINKIIELKGDIRLLLETSSVVAESFIIDLITYFYLQNTKQLIKPEQPLKLVIVIDNYDLISGSINLWLSEYFLHYCYNKSFNDFISYNVNIADKSLKVSDFFDFRFIMAERDKLPAKLLSSSWSRFSDDLLNLEVDVFSEDDSREYLTQTYPDTDYKDLSTVGNCHGIPFMINKWIEYIATDRTENDKARLYNSVLNEITRYNTENQREWIQCAAFLDDFDIYGIRCFPLMNKNYIEIFSFFENSSGITARSTNDSTKITVHPVIREYICEVVSITMFNKAKEFKTVAKIYNDSAVLLKNLNLTGREVVRNLSYFKRFNDGYAVETSFQTDVEKAREFIKDNPGWLINHDFTYSVKPEKAASLMAMNRLLDAAEFDDKQLAIKFIWESYENKLKKELAEDESKIPALFDEISSLEKENNQLKSDYDESQRKFMALENELINMRKKLAYYSNKKSLTAAITNFFVACISLALAYIFPDIFSSPESHDPIVVIQLILYITSSLFGFIGLLNLIKAFIILFRKKELKQLTAYIQELDDDKSSLNTNMKEIKEKRDSIQKKVTELNDTIKQLHTGIRTNRQKLLESFI